MVEEGRWWRSRKRGRRRVEKEITRRWTTRFAWKLVSVLAKSYYALSFSSFAPFILSFSPLVLSSLPFSVALSLLRLSSLSLSLFSLLFSSLLFLLLTYIFSLSLSFGSLPLSLSLSLRDESMRAYEHKREKFYSHQHQCKLNVAHPTSSLFLRFSLSLSLSLSSLLALASLLLLSNLTPRKRAHNRVSVLFNVGGLLLTNTSLKSSSGSFHLLLLLLLPLPPLPLLPLSSS